MSVVLLNSSIQAYNYWLNDMYMNVTLPLPINSNPGMVLPPRKFTTVHDVARFSARLIDGIIEHKEMLDRFVSSLAMLNTACNNFNRKIFLAFQR